MCGVVLTGHGGLSKSFTGKLVLVVAPSL